MNKSGIDRSIEEILRLSTEERESEYQAVGIDHITIDGNVFKNYKDFQFIWEKSYRLTPKRSDNGQINNLNSYATFVTPHLLINYDIMSIDDYRRFVRLDLERNEHIIECYDVVYDKKIVVKMYFTPLQLAKLYTISKRKFNTDGSWEEWVDLVGVKEYTLEMVGTNSDIDFVNVIYNINKPADATGDTSLTEGEPDVYKGDEIIIGKSSTFQKETFNNKYKFNKWTTNPDGTGIGYPDQQQTTIYANLTLYAQWSKQ